MNSKRFCVIIAVPAVLLSIPYPLQAQDPVAWVRSEARDTPGAEGALASSRPEVTVGVTEEGANLSAIFGVEFGSSLRHSVEVRLTGKLESGQQELELANRSDLPGGVEGTLRFSSALSNAPDPTSLCRELNELLGTQVLTGPTLPEAEDISDGDHSCAERDPCKKPPSCLRTVADALSTLECALDAGSDDLSGKARYEAYRQLWRDLYTLWDLRKAQLKAGEGDDPSDLEKFERVMHQSVDFPTIDETEDKIIRALCTKWNKERIAGLLLVDVPGSPEGNVEKRLADLSTRCSIDNLIDRHTTEATQAAIRSARNTHADKLASAEVNHQREKKVAETITDPNVRQEALTKASKKRDDAFQQAAVELANATDELAMTALQKKTENTVYEELATAMAKEAARWNGVGAPFITTRPGEVASVSTDPGMVCGTDDIEAAFAAAPARLAWRMRKTVERLVPPQWFVTASLKNSSQNFTYAKADRSTDPESGLIATTRDNEHHYSGRVGLSYLHSGTLWTAGVGRKRVWEGAPNVEFCFEGDGSDVLLCSSTGLGPPSRKDTSVYDVQWKHQLSPGWALQAQIFFEDQKDVLTSQLITYFLPQQEKLRGGLSFSYTEGAEDATEGFNARLFVGVPFELGGIGK